MPERLTFTFPEKYDPAAMSRFVLAINQKLDSLADSLKGSAGGQTVVEVSGGSLVITDVRNNLPIGHGNWFELTVLSANANLTGMSKRDPGQFVILKNSSASSNSLPIVHNSSASSPGNRFFNRNEQDIVIPVNGARLFIYSDVFPGWIPVAEVP